MKKYIEMIRAKHYIKNLLIFVPAFFGRKIFDKSLIFTNIIGFLSFCMIASSIYIVNDLKDIQKDRNHYEKKKRPIASGQISKQIAICWLIALLTISIALLLFCQEKNAWKSIMWILLYLTINVLYSFGLKNIPIVDVMILAAGFVIRVLYGAALDDINVSSWLYLTVWSISLYMGLGKRRNEIIQQKNAETRMVLKFYSDKYLNNMMHISMSLTIVFYSLWSANVSNYSNITPQMIWTLPLILAIVMRYEMVIESSSSSGDPVKVLLSDKALLMMSFIYILFVMSVIYI